MVFLVAGGDSQQGCDSGVAMRRETAFRAGTRSAVSRALGPPEEQRSCGSPPGDQKPEVSTPPGSPKLTVLDLVPVNQDVAHLGNIGVYP